MTDLHEADRAYIERLYAALGETSRDFDRTVLSLASGSLVVSITFLRDIAPTPTHSIIIVIAWTALGTSVLSTLLSYFTSERALLHSVNQVLDGDRDRSRGGAWGTATDWLNAIAGLTFFVGAVLLICFAIVNLPEWR